MNIPDFIIVDDDASNNFICESAIRILFPESTIKLFTNPAEAMKIINEEYNISYNKNGVILFLDINMPYQSGWAFLTELKNSDFEFRRQFVIYMLSSSIDPSDKELASSHPLVSGFLSKPLIVRELRQLLANDFKSEIS